MFTTVTGCIALHALPAAPVLLINVESVHFPNCIVCSSCVMFQGHFLCPLMSGLHVVIVWVRYHSVCSNAVASRAASFSLCHCG